MRHLSTSRVLQLVALFAFTCCGAGAKAQATAAGPQRFVDIVELTDHDDQADIAIVFTCSVRYVTHLPTDEGKELRIELQPLPDCNVSPGAQIAGELPPLSGGEKIISAVRVESDVPGQLALVFSWRKAERFVVAQGVDPRGLRVRLIDRARGRGKIIINESSDNISSFAINLESQPSKFDPGAMALAHDRLGAAAYVSEAVVDGDKWYRLRVGPFEKRANAETVLTKALSFYPRAWLAVGDDILTNEAGGPLDEGNLPAVQKIGSDPAADAATLKKLLAESRAVLSARDYAGAISRLTKLQRQSEFPERAQAQELLGLARERAGQFAHAKAEYEEYLRRYPKGDAAERVANRLRTLRAASAKGHETGQASAQQNGWQFSGGFAQQARLDNTSVKNDVVDPNATVPLSAKTNTSALFNDVDLLARRRGGRFDMMARVSAGYAKTFGDVGGLSSDTKRVSTASFELADRSLGLLARLGRQTRNGNGVLGTFDGLFLSYQFRPSWDVTATVGYPVERSDQSVKSDRRFETVSLSYTPPNAHWDASVFGTTQTFERIKDRQAVGLEARYLIPTLSVVALIDYDTFYKSFNTASVLGTVQLPARWSLSFDVEHRNSPVLTTRNALIGQPDTTLAALQTVFTTLDEIYHLARDRTPVTTNYSLTASRPLGERFQFSTTVSSSQTGATGDFGGVPAQLASGQNLTYQAQIYGSSVWHRGDFNVLSIAYSNTDTAKVASLGITTRFPLNDFWRIGPRLSVDRRTLASDGSTETDLLPSVLLDYQHGRRLLQFETGGQIGKRDTTAQTQNVKRYYLSLAYRLSF